MSTASVSLDLTGPQLQALSALLAGASSAEAAAAGSVSPRTLRDWLQQPEFRAEFLHGQQQLFHQISMQLAGAAARALRTLIEISEDPEQKGSVRVSAANKVMHLFLHHGPRVSALLEPSKVEKEPAAPDPRSAVYENLMAALDRVYGPDDDAEAGAPAAAPPPPAHPAPTLSQPEFAASASTGNPPATPDAAPHDTPAPPLLTLSLQSSAETSDPLRGPGVTYVPWRG